MRRQWLGVINFVCLFALGGILQTAAHLPVPKQPIRTAQASQPPLYPQLANLATYTNLPVAKVSFSPATKDGPTLGTAILIPQYHRLPGSSLNASINDQAVKNQREIYQILNFLLEQYKIQLVGIEGMTNTDTSESKVRQVAQKLRQKDPLDREVILAGAPIVLAAQGKPLWLAGCENPTTQEQSRKLVREYLYVQSLSQRSLVFSYLTHNLQQEYESQIEQVIVRQRNFETAANFVAALQKHSVKVGALPFGAGHTQGLTKALNQAGVAVIVVTPTQVAQSKLKTVAQNYLAN